MRIKFLIIRRGKHLIPGIEEENAKQVQDPVKPLHERHAGRDKNDPEQNGHQNTDQERSRDVFFLYRERRKDEHKDKNVVDAQAPFHQVGAEIFKRDGLPPLDPDKNQKSQGEADPKKSLVEGLADGNDLVLLAEQTQVKGEGQNEENSKNGVDDLVGCHAGGLSCKDIRTGEMASGCKGIVGQSGIILFSGELVL